MCVPSAEAPRPVAAPSGGNWQGETGYTQGWQQGSTGGSVYSGSGANAYPQGQDKEKASKSDNPTGAVLTNPFAIILTPALYGFGVIPLEIQLGGDYAALDIQGALFVGGGDVLGGAGEIGLRILPMGKGLKGFYLVPRIGGGSPMGFMGTGELGFAVFPGHFVMNFGAGCGGASEVEDVFIWFGNISIGFGG